MNASQAKQEFLNWNTHYKPKGKNGLDFVYYLGSACLTADYQTAKQTIEFLKSHPIEFCIRKWCRSKSKAKFEALFFGEFAL
jgi:hypothetical protein